MVDWYIGTMGFSYKDWVGVFYPEDLAGRDFLSYYSRVFNAAEIDSTFYGTPKSSTVERWKSITPDGFQFCAKVPRVITHDLGLIGAEGLMTEFIQSMLPLEEKLGVILLQFPPSFAVDQLPVLATFLGFLPRELRFAVEVRHRSWYTAKENVREVLEQFGIAWAATQYPRLPREINHTAPFLYIRWIGQHGTFENHTHERIDRSEDLEGWVDLINQKIGQLEAVYGFTNNDYAGFAAGTANRFKEIAGLPVKPLRSEQQKRLF